MGPTDGHDRARRRRQTRLTTLQRRLRTGSALGFVALFGLAAQHAVGSSKHRHPAARALATPGVAAESTRFFDEAGGNYAFADPAPAPADAAQAAAGAPAQAAPEPAPPVAQTSVS